jgi:hypothetical protein
MKSKPKNLYPKFNGYASGVLLLRQASSAHSLLSIRADEIKFLRLGDFKNTHVYLTAEKSREIQVNFMLINHFWQRSRMTGESFDLRPICSLPQSNPLHHIHRNPDLDLHAKKQLADKVIRLNPLEIY